MLQLTSKSLVSPLQTVITEINQKIGASGVVSQECKTVVAEYGQQILELLLVEVCVSVRFTFQHLLFLDITRFSPSFYFLQTNRAKICSRAGLCAFDGTHGVRLAY